MSFRDNPIGHRYELLANGFLSFADYREVAGVRVIQHVETPDAARGQGLASKLMGEIVADAKARGLKLRASCPFAVAYFKRHPDAAVIEA